MWSDIDYLDNYRDFTYDPIKYAGLPEYIEELHNKSMYYVPIIDAGVSMRSWGTYDFYNEGVANHSFITINNANETFIGMVWPKEAAYPDFFSEAGVNFWKNSLTKMHNSFAFDGLW
jgi:alpha-glucosidase (family GH31 glycosyl hydrolase)